MKNVFRYFLVLSPLLIAYFVPFIMHTEHAKNQCERSIKTEIIKNIDNIE